MRGHVRATHMLYTFNAILLAVVICAHHADAADRPLRHVVDEHMRSVWQQHQLDAAPPADDGAFMRHVYLDLCGTIPTHDEAVAFLDDTDPAKRAKLIDKLLDDPRYAQHQADVWDMLLFGRDPGNPEARKRDATQRWLRDRFADNTPYDAFVRALIEAEGDSAEHGPPMYLVQYRNRPEAAAEAVTETFLGTQLQCARCHDHPYEAWKQTDFYGFAAFFVRLEVVNAGKHEKETRWMIGEKNTGEMELTGPAGEMEPGKQGDPVAPRFLGGDVLDEPPLPEELAKKFEKGREKFDSNKPPPAPHFSRKDKLAAWLTSPDNKLFAKTAVNRLWSQLMGRGLVHPVDDISSDNPAVSPELFEHLAARFVERKFDIKWLLRELCNTNVYQLASLGNEDDPMPVYFERARVRPLSAEELAEAWRVATDYAAVDGEKLAERLERGERFFPLTSGYMLSFFGEPSNGEGHFQGGLHEHLYLNNGQLAQVISRNKGGLHHAVMESDKPWEQRIDRLFVSVLTRRPTDAERQRFVDYLADEDTRSDRLEEAIWALMTCSEFRFNH